MRILFTQLLVVSVCYCGVAAANEPLPLPAPEETSLSATASEPLYQELTCCPEAVKDCTANDCYGTTCDCESCQDCEDCETGPLRRRLGCYKCPGPYCHQMMLHLPYRPAFTGDYYFRPYNYKQVLAERVLGPRLGETVENPYSSSSFEMIYRQFEASYDAGPAQENPPNPDRLTPSVPNLEDLLEKS